MFSFHHPNRVCVFHSSCLNLDSAKVTFPSRKQSTIEPLNTLVNILCPSGILAALVAIVMWGSYAGLMKSPALSKARVSPWVFQLYMNFGVFLASGWYATACPLCRHLSRTFSHTIYVVVPRH
jgi:hypothetical protein